MTVGLTIIFIGLLNSMPVIPGLQPLVAGLTGLPNIPVRAFPFQIINPLAFLVMMLVVVARHSAFAAARGRGARARGAGLALDLALIAVTLAVVLGYLIEHDSVCLIDRITGDRAALMARALEAERANAALFGMPMPTTVENPACIGTLGAGLLWLMVAALTVFMVWTVRVWGLSLALVAIFFAAYAVLTVGVWYLWGSDGVSKYLVTKLGPEPRQLSDGIPALRDALTNGAQGLLGRFMSILMGTVFPYLVLGGLFGVSAGGRALIKLAFLWTRRLRGGPAHAAILSSSLFGTISGGPVVNVLSTGVLTIPMMLKSGFRRNFAGGVEAAASSGGQIMPPVMGVAAFVLASMTMVPYKDVILAALLPCLAYFGCMFAMVLFEARRLDIRAVRDLPDEMRLTRADRINLLMILLPMALILSLLMTPKEAVGCGPIAALFGVERIVTDSGCRAVELPWLFRLVQNSAGDAGSAGWWAAALLVALFFLDADIRRQPRRIITALADAGVQTSTLYLMFLAVSVIDFCLNFTGLSVYLALDITHLLRALAGADSGAGFLMLALMVTMLLAILLGMGMPTVPAYINVALLMGPMLAGLGIANFTAHMFIFFFAVASAITPPVAVAAFAAASITGADPMRTGFAALRAGAVMFIIPFVFAFHPELLLIPQAQLDPNAAGIAYLPGYDGSVPLIRLAGLVAALALGVWLLASALVGYDRWRLTGLQRVARLGAAVLCLTTVPALIAAGFGLGALLILKLRLPLGRRQSA